MLDLDGFDASKACILRSRPQGCHQVKAADDSWFTKFTSMISCRISTSWESGHSFPEKEQKTLFSQNWPIASSPVCIYNYYLQYQPRAPVKKRPKKGHSTGAFSPPWKPGGRRHAMHPSDPCRRAKTGDLDHPLVVRASADIRNTNDIQW